MKTREHYEATYRLRHAEGQLAYTPTVFGDELAKRQQYKSDLDGLEAVYYYLIQKHHWTPAVVKGMSYEDLRFALSEEMNGFVLPKEAIFRD